MAYLDRTINSAKVIVINNHFLIRTGLKTFVNSLQDYHVISDYDNSKKIVSIVSEQMPNIVIANLTKDNLHNCYELSKIFSTRIIFTIDDVEPTIMQEAVKLSCASLIMSTSIKEELHVCLKYIRSNRIYLDNHIKAVLAENKQKNISYLSKTLSKQQLKILHLIANRKTTLEIANELYRSPKTIENIRYQISKKLCLNGPNSLLIFALEYRNSLMAT